MSVRRKFPYIVTAVRHGNGICPFRFPVPQIFPAQKSSRFIRKTDDFFCQFSLIKIPAPRFSQCFQCLFVIGQCADITGTGYISIFGKGRKPALKNRVVFIYFQPLKFLLPLSRHKIRYGIPFFRIRNCRLKKRRKRKFAETTGQFIPRLRSAGNGHGNPPAQGHFFISPLFYRSAAQFFR